MSLKKIQHPMLRNSEITYGFFTRSGGVSQKPYKSLNCGFNNKDSKLNVNNNIEIVRQNLNLNKVIKLDQIHSSKVITIENHNKIYDFKKADGIVTNLSGIGLSILGADCAPILFYDKKSKTIGACHAGWRGAVNNIIEATISKMEAIGALRSQITAIIGPTIQKNSYEIEEDVARIIKSCSFFKENEFILSHNKPNKYLFDLPLLLKQSLKSAMIRNIGDVKIDTYKNDDLFFSHRRSTHKNLEHRQETGRQISVIGLLN